MTDFLIFVNKIIGDTRLKKPNNILTNNAYTDKKRLQSPRKLSDHMLERRLIVQLLSYWENKCNGRSMMAEEDLNWEELKDLAPDCFLIKTATDNDGIKYEMTTRGDALHDQWPDSSQLKADIQTVVNKKSYVMDDQQLFDSNGSLLKFRICMLPLGDGSQVSAILGGARFKKA